MNKVLKIVLGIIVSLYLILVVFTTAFLLNRNDYGVSKFLNKYLVIVDDDSLKPKYQKHSLLAIEAVDNDEIKIDQKVFFYDTYGTDHKIKLQEVTKKEKINENETTFTMKDNSLISSQYIIGTEDSTSELVAFGQFLYVVQSKWGFLFIVVFPLFLAFIYEVYAIYKEFKSKK